MLRCQCSVYIVTLICSDFVLCRTSASATTWESAGRSISRVPGMAIYISESSTGLPAAFVSMLRSVGVVHTAVIFLTVERVCPPAYLWQHCTCPGQHPCCMHCPAQSQHAKRPELRPRADAN